MAKGVLTSPNLPSRLVDLYIWLANVIEAPLLLWWAASQGGLHPSIVSRIKYTCEALPDSISNAWDLLFKYWEDCRTFDEGRIYRVEREVKKNGWSKRLLKEYMSTLKTRLSVKPKPLSLIELSQKDGVFDVHDVLDVDVKYPDRKSLTVSDEYLVLYLKKLRVNIELAAELEDEIHEGNDVNPSFSIIPDENGSNGFSYEREEGLGGVLLQYVDGFEALINYDKSKASEEFRLWPFGIAIFTRLRVWLYGREAYLDSTEAGTFYENLQDEFFWDYDGRRDLLISLANRWNEFDCQVREKLEVRLFKGPPKYEGQTEEEYRLFFTGIILDVTAWLKKQGVTFLNYDVEHQRLLALNPEWNEDHLERVVESRECRGGYVETDSECSELLSMPIKNLISEAKRIANEESEFLRRRNPFEGVLKENPKRAVLALLNDAKNDRYEVKFWEKFFYLDEEIPSRGLILVAGRLLGYPENFIKQLIHPITSWLNRSGEFWFAQAEEVFYKLVDRLSLIISVMNECETRSKREKYSRAVNSITGKISRLMFIEPNSCQNSEASVFDFKQIRFDRVEKLLALPGANGEDALSIFSRDLNWFYCHQKDWTEKYLLSELGGERKESFWIGFFRGRHETSDELYIRLKDEILNLSSNQKPSHDSYGRTLAAVLLRGWLLFGRGIETRLIENRELRETLIKCDEQFRIYVIWFLQSYCGKPFELKPEVVEFFQSVWPNQLAVKTSKISEKLFTFLIESGEKFEELYDLIFSHLSTVENEHVSVYALYHHKDSIIKKYPQKVFLCLERIFGERHKILPYDLGKVLTELEEADQSLSVNRSFIEMKRCWDSRGRF